jgi:hypothetical protein
MIKLRLVGLWLALSVLLGIGLVGVSSATAANEAPQPLPVAAAAPAAIPDDPAPAPEAQTAAYNCDYCLVIYHDVGSHAYNLRVAKDGPATCANSTQAWLPRGWTTRGHPELTWADAECFHVPAYWDAIVRDYNADPVDGNPVCVYPTGWRALSEPPYVTQYYRKDVQLIRESDTRC